MFGLSLTKPVYEWLEAGWLGKAERRSGALIAVDAKLEKRSELRFKDAVVAATTLPAMDAAAKTSCVLTARVEPRSTSRHAASGKVAVAQPKAQAQWLPSNFRLEIDGLDCTRVSKVDALTIPSPEAGAVDFPDLRITLAEANAKTWVDWHESFVVKRNSVAEKTGSLVFLSPDRKSELGRLRSSHSVYTGWRRSAGGRRRCGTSSRSSTASGWSSPFEVTVDALPSRGGGTGTLGDRPA